MKTPTPSAPAFLALLVIVAWLPAPSARAATTSATQTTLETVAERSKFLRTGHYDEVERLCEAYARTWPDLVKCVEFGRTPEGRPMLALVASRSGALDPNYATRVRVTHNIIMTLSGMMSREGSAWRAQTLEADARAVQGLGGSRLPAAAIS